MRRPRPITVSKRIGSALLSVLIVIVMLSLAAYTYTDSMITEYEASQRMARMTEARQLADSGVDYVAQLVAQRGTESEQNLYHNPELLHMIPVIPGDATRPTGYFSVVSPVESDESTGSVRFGLRNESARINVNALANGALTEDEARAFLMVVPNMTDVVADAILDWIDADDTPRAYGAESSYYAQFSPPYACKNQALISLEELLAVDGVTLELLFGEDRNRNGLLDPNEDANGDGRLDLGWSEYLTVLGRESNLRADGGAKINLNSNDLSALYDDIAAEFDEEAAKFVVAYRIYGDSSRDDAETPGGIAGTGSGNSGGMTPEEEELMRAITRGLTQAMLGNPGGNVTRGGMDLKDGGANRINSIYDLVDAQVEATIDGNPETLNSPWTSDPADVQTYIALLLDTFGTTGNTWIEGRIDINQARYETLLGVPGMTEEIALSIVESKTIGTYGEPLPSVLETHATNGWLLIEGIVDLATMRQLDPFITTRGDVFQAQIVGYFDKSAIASRVNVFVDATQKPVRILSYSDYTELGAGYPLRIWQDEQNLR